MRFDHITTTNGNLEKTALYLDQVAELYRSEANKLATAAKLMRQLADTAPADADPLVDMQAFELPAVLKPGSQADAFRRQGAVGSIQPPLTGGTLQNHRPSVPAGQEKTLEEVGN